MAERAVEATVDAVTRIGPGTPMSDARAAVVFCITFALSALPLCFVTYPPLHDYPFHIARIFIFDHWHQSPLLRTWYTLHSFLLPDVGMDLVVLLIAQVLPVKTAGLVFVALTLALTLGGCVFLYRSLHGSCALWPFAAALFLFNWIFLLGFLNYLFGIAMLLWGLGVWVRLAEAAPWLRFVAGTAFAVVLFFCHLMALGLYAVAIAGFELQRAAATVRANRRAALRDLVLGAAVFVVPFALFLASRTAGETSGIFAYRSPAYKILVLRMLTSGNLAYDIVLAVMVLLFFLGLIRTGRMRPARPMVLALAFLLAAFIVMPNVLLSATYVDARMPVAIAFIAISSTRVSFRDTVWNRGFAVSLAALLVLRAGLVSVDWSRSERIINAFTGAFADLPAGAVLLALSETPSPSIRDISPIYWHPPLKHVVSLATLHQTVFVPATWAHPAQQPITVKPPYTELYAFQGQNPFDVTSAEELHSVIDRGRILTAGLPGHPPAFLLVLYPEALGLEIPQDTPVVASGPNFLLLAL